MYWRKLTWAQIDGDRGRRGTLRRRENERERVRGGEGSDLGLGGRRELGRRAGLDDVRHQLGETDGVDNGGDQAEVVEQEP
jgi:hypothetical protein